MNYSVYNDLFNECFFVVVINALSFSSLDINIELGTFQTIKSLSNHVATLSWCSSILINSEPQILILQLLNPDGFTNE